MNARDRLSGFWASVRPRTRRGGTIAAAAILAGAAMLAVGIVAGAAMAWNPYLEYSLDNTVDARGWAGHEMTFASSDQCAECHEAEAAAAVSASHEGIGCQSCHGPLLEHVEAGEDADSNSVAVAVPTDVVCVRCHVQAEGRPAGLREIIPTQHYVSVCIQCHEPHSAIANRPPIVEHPLDDLPPCLTCHGPEGFKARNQWHPAGTSDDKPCLDCHAPGRGPLVDEVGL